MPSGLPDQRPDGSEKPKDEERQRNYTPQNELGLPASKFTERVSEEALEDATGSWEKPSPETGEDVGRVSSRSVQIVGMGFAVIVALVSVPDSGIDARIRYCCSLRYPFD